MHKEKPGIKSLLVELTDADLALWHSSARIMSPPIPPHFHFIKCSEKNYTERTEWLHNNVKGRYGFEPTLSSIIKEQSIPIFSVGSYIAFEDKGDAAFYILTFSEENK